MIKRIRGYLPRNLNDLVPFKRNLPIIIGVTVKNHFLEGFRQGGKMTDKSRSGWAKRKREYGKRGRRSNRAILVDTGALRADIKVRSNRFDSIRVGTRNIQYAEYHNEGTERLPQREFIGQSRELDRKITAIIKKELDKLLINR